MSPPEGVGAGEFRSRATVPPAGFCYRMAWKGSPVNDPDYFTWSHFGLQGPDGKYHLFGERIASETIRKNTAHIAWGHITCAEIAHYTADDPEGPYRFADVPLKRGVEDEFDPSMIYPTVHQDGNRWVMMYNGIKAIGDGHCSLHGAVVAGDGRVWRGGLAVADSLDGPWRKVGEVLSPSNDPAHFTYQAAIHVPSMVPFRGKWFAYFHTGPGKPGGYGLPNWGPDGTDCIGVAVADRPEGPWRIMDQPAFQQPSPGKKGGHVTVEDVGAYVWNDRVYLLCSDFFGHVTGVVGGVALFVSEDGLSFPFEKARLAVDLIPAYYKSYDPSRVKIWWEPSLPNRLEAPRHYDIDGDKIYALVQHYETKPREKGKWEAHRLYLDVHYVAAGIETLGYAPVGNLTAIQAYEPADDYTLFRGHGDFVTASAGMFVVFFPEDAHMPCLACETPVPVRKVVVKVAVEAGR